MTGPGGALFGVHQNFDTHLFELSLDDLGDGDAIRPSRPVEDREGEACPILHPDSVRADFPAGGIQQRLGLLQIQVVDGGVAVVVRAVRRNLRRRNRHRALQQVRGNRLAVDGVIHGLADIRVRKQQLALGRLYARAELDKGVPMNQVGRIAIDGLEVRHLVRGEAQAQVELFRLHRGQPRVVVGDEAEDDFIQQDRAAPVVRVLHDADIFARLPFGKLERAGANRAAVEGLIAADVRGLHALEQMRGHHRLKEGVVGRVRRLPGEQDRVLVDRRAAFDIQVLVLVVDLGLGDDVVPGEAHILAGKFDAIVPLDTLLQVPGHINLAVRPLDRAAVGIGGDLFGQHRDIFVLVVADDQPFHHRDLRIGQVLAGEGVQHVDLGAVGHVQDLLARGRDFHLGRHHGGGGGGGRGLRVSGRGGGGRGLRIGRRGRRGWGLRIGRRVGGSRGLRRGHGGGGRARGDHDRQRDEPSQA